MCPLPQFMLLLTPCMEWMENFGPSHSQGQNEQEKYFFCQNGYLAAIFFVGSCQRYFPLVCAVPIWNKSDHFWPSYLVHKVNRTDAWTDTYYSYVRLRRGGGQLHFCTWKYGIRVDDNRINLDDVILSYLFTFKTIIFHIKIKGRRHNHVHFFTISVKNSISMCL